MRKQYKKIVTLAAALCAMILLGSQAVLAASYPLLIAKTSLLTCEEAEKVSLQYYYYPQYVNEKIESTIYDPTGAAVAQSSDTKYNTTAQLSTYTLTWDTTGMEGGEYTAETTISYYSRGQWWDAPTKETIYITVKGDNDTLGGNTYSDAKIINFSEQYRRAWTASTYDKNSYNKFTVPKRGYVVLKVKKMTEDDGSIYSFHFSISNAQGRVIWAADSANLENSSSDYYQYKVGLQKGTYYFNMKPSIRIRGGKEETTYSISYKPTNYFEIESNDTKKTATLIKMGKIYTGVYGDQSYDYTYEDYYKVKLKKGKMYQFILKNAGTLDEDTSTLVTVLEPSGKKVKMAGADLLEKGKVKLKAAKSGYYYIKFSNYGNQIPVEYKIAVKNNS